MVKYKTMFIKEMKTSSELLEQIIQVRYLINGKEMLRERSNQVTPSWSIELQEKSQVQGQHRSI